MENLPDDFDGNLQKYKLPVDDLYFIQKNYKNLILILSKNSFKDITQILHSKNHNPLDVELQESLCNLLDESFPSLKCSINKSCVQNVKMGEDKIGKSTIYFCCFHFYSFRITASVQFYNDNDCKENAYDCCLTLDGNEAFYHLNKGLHDFAVKKRANYIEKINTIASALGFKGNKNIALLNKFLLQLAFYQFAGIDPLYDFADFYNLHMFC